MIRAGISIRAALEGISEQVQNQKFRKILQQIRTDVESGKQFSDAIAKHSKLFGPLYYNMVRASEMSGSFADMLDRIKRWVTRPNGSTSLTSSDSLFGSFVGLFVTRIQSADKRVQFRSQAFLPPTATAAPAGTAQ